MDESEILALMENSAQDAICFKAVFPPRHDTRPTTYFGGLPLLPNGFEWPTSVTTTLEDGTPVPLTFLGQINCAELPDCDASRLLPDEGLLQFYIDWEFQDAGEARVDPFRNFVIFHPGPIRQFREANSPPHLPPCHGESASWQHEWRKHTGLPRDAHQKVFPKWAFEPFRVTTYEGRDYCGIEDYEAGEIYHQLYDEHQLQRFIDVVGQGTCGIPSNAPHEPYWKSYPGFPEAWISVEIFAGHVCERMYKAAVIPLQQPGLPDVTQPMKDPQREAFRQVLMQARDWVARCHEKGLYTALSDNDRIEFQRWYEQIIASADGIHDPRHSFAIRKCLAYAFFRGPDLCLSHSTESAALISDEVRETLRWKHSPVYAAKHVCRHQLLGIGTGFDYVTYRYDRDHIRLMQFVTDPGMDWMFGDCSTLQYWIWPDDLAAGDFTKVRVFYC